MQCKYHQPEQSTAMYNVYLINIASASCTHFSKGALFISVFLFPELMSSHHSVRWHVTLHVDGCWTCKHQSNSSTEQQIMEQPDTQRRRMRTSSVKDERPIRSPFRFNFHWTFTDGFLNPKRLRVHTRGPLIGIPFICVHNDYRRSRTHSPERPYAETQLTVIKT